MDKILMKSANGTIWTGRVRKSGREIVVKQFPKKTVCEYLRLDGRKCPSEVFYHFQSYKLDPLVVVQPIEWFEDKTSYLIVMERPVGWIDLFEFVNKFGAQCESNARLIFHQLVVCVEKLHRGGVCHSDIKDENVMVNPRTLQIKLIDFGCARRVENLYARCRGTPHYWPPEWFRTQTYRPEPLTVWSLGSVLYLLLVGKWNFENGGHLRDFKAELRLSKPAQYLLNSLLCPHDTSRISLKNIRRTSWVNWNPFMK